MRIIIDMQGAQTASRSHGIGRYVTSFSQAMVRNSGVHEIILALSGLFPDTIEPIRNIFESLLPLESILVWDVPGPVNYLRAPRWRREIAEHIREQFIAHLKPEMVLVSSLFEGLGDDAVTSVGRISREIPTAVVLYDLIPYIHRPVYLKDPVREQWYLNKLDHLRRANLLLSISEWSRQQAIRYLGCDERSVINISAAANAQFSPRNVSPLRERELRETFGLTRSFVMCTGGAEPRKNVEALIRAYADLPADIRQRHQLAVVCSIHDHEQLTDLARQERLAPCELNIIGFVSEDDLVDLYNLCAVFVFPSWHEGFGLPALEAMSCGAPVIGANATSLPEVIGRDDALFDPHDDNDIRAKLTQVLTDEAFRKGLAHHGLERARRFSWDTTAKRALCALEQWHRETEKCRITVTGRRPKLAYVSPLPPERSGISDYSAELLPQLSRHFEIEVIMAQQKVRDPYIAATFPARTVNWFQKHADSYDRVLYQFGNSPFHRHMLGLLEEIPGVVVLHDFFLGSLLSHMDIHGLLPNGWASELYISHGYEAIRQRFHAKSPDDVALRYPCSLRVLEHARGIIVHSANSLRLAKQWYGRDPSDWAVIPHLRAPWIGQNRMAARKALGFGVRDFLVCAFGMLAPTKLNHRLLQAWLKSSLPRDRTCHLVFVGENHGGTYGRDLLATIRRNSADRNVHITGWVDLDVYRQYLAAADIGIQLRALSRGETSGAVLDCMACGLATVVNANGGMADLDNDAAWKLPDDFTDAQLIDALETLRKDAGLRQTFGARAREIVLEKHNPRTCAAQFHDAIERFYISGTNGIHTLASAIADIEYRLDDDDLIDISKCIAVNMPPSLNQRQLLLDISATCHSELKTGIERAARALILAFLEQPPVGFRVEPVYLSDEGRTWHYRYARRFTLNLLACPPESLADDPVDFRAGDILLGLDISGQRLIEAEAAGLLADYRNRGVAVYFTVFDLLPLRLPQHFPPGADVGHEKWLRALLKTDGALCISRSVADDLRDWTRVCDLSRQQPFRIGWFHLGADLDNAAPARGMPKQAAPHLAALAARPSFLMVGTIEPRKGYLHVLEAFDQLWNQGLDLNLTIVGTEGWLHASQDMRRTIPQIIARLQSHPALGTRLFWANGSSDEYLERIYAASSCLIAASEGEGFGLPLIEAARHKVPIIARDIPVFREIAGEHAFYFADGEPHVLAKVIVEWLTLYEKGEHPKSDAMPWITWRHSAARLEEILFGADWYYVLYDWRQSRALEMGEGEVKGARSDARRS